MNKLLCVVSVIGILCSTSAHATTNVDPNASVVRGMACSEQGATHLNYNETEILYCLNGFWRIASTANLPLCQQQGKVATTDGVNINCVSVLPPVCIGAGHYLQFDGLNWQCNDVNGNLITNTNTAVSTPPPTETTDVSHEGDNCHLGSDWDNRSLGQNRGNQ